MPQLCVDINHSSDLYRVSFSVLMDLSSLTRLSLTDGDVFECVWCTMPKAKPLTLVTKWLLFGGEFIFSLSVAVFLEQ
jgi:hypothetical protein